MAWFSADRVAEVLAGKLGDRVLNLESTGRVRVRTEDILAYGFTCEEEDISQAATQMARAIGRDFPGRIFFLEPEIPAGVDAYRGGYEGLWLRVMKHGDVRNGIMSTRIEVLVVSEENVLPEN